MPHQNTVFHAILAVGSPGTSSIGWSRRTVPTSGRAGSAPGASSWRMLYAQLSGAGSLREIEAGHEEPRQIGSTILGCGRPGARRWRRPTCDRPASVFSDLFAFLVSRLQRGRARRALAGASTYLIDSTALPLDQPERELGALLRAGLRGEDACDLRRRCRAADLCRVHARPTSTTSPRPMRCQSRPGRHTCLIWATTITNGGRS